ncbi:MAG TPA: Calx-beta domain-containing protein [Pyrinomonadaceae bacterium]
MKRPYSVDNSRSIFGRVLVLTIGALSAFCMIGFLPHTAAAVPLISIPDVTVDEGDSLDYRTVQVPISYSGAFQLRVQITVRGRARGGRVPAFNRLRGIQALTTSRILHGTGVETIFIRVRGDLNREADEVADVRLTFSSLVQGGPGGDAGVFTLRDDDHPTVTVTDSFWVEGGTVDLPDGGRHVIRLSKAINQSTNLRAQTISNTAIAGRDFVGVDTLVTIAGGQTEAAVLVPRIDDNFIDLELSREYFLSVTPVREGDIGIGGDPEGLGRVNDDENVLGQEAIFQLDNDPIPPPFAGGTVANCRSALPTDEPFNSNVDRRFRLTFASPIVPRFEVRIITSSGGGAGEATAGQDYDSVDQVLLLQTDRDNGQPRPFRSVVFTVRIRDDGVSEGDETIRIEAIGAVINPNARPCGFQILTGAQSDIKINGNLF